MKLVTFTLDTWYAAEVCERINTLGAADYVLSLYPTHFGDGVGCTTVFLKVPDGFDTTRLPCA